MTLTMPFRSRRPPVAPEAVLPPLVTRTAFRDREDWWRRTEADLAPVLVIVGRLGLTAAGFRLAAERECGINEDATITKRGDVEKLLLAREAIRSAAMTDGTFWGLPQAILHYRGIVVELFGDRKPGTPWESTYSHAGGVSLAGVQLAQGREH